MNALTARLLEDERVAAVFETRDDIIGHAGIWYSRFDAIVIGCKGSKMGLGSDKPFVDPISCRWVENDWVDRGVSTCFAEHLAKKNLAYFVGTALSNRSAIEVDGSRCRKFGTWEDGDWVESGITE